MELDAVARLRAHTKPDIHAVIRTFVHIPRRIDSMLGYLQRRTGGEDPAAA